MGKWVLYNATILEGKDLEVTRGYLAIRNGVIEEIGEGTPPKRNIDVKHGFILPPFINSHTHLADSVAKDLYLGLEQQAVVGPSGIKFQVLRSKPKGEILRAMIATLHDMAETGTLAHCDFREDGVAGIKLLQEVPSQPITSIVLGRPTDLTELEKLLAISDGVGLPSLREFDRASTREIANRTLKAGKLLSAHVAETKEAQNESLEETEKTEVQLALDLGTSFVVHGTWSTEGDLAALRRARVPVVFCPRANSLLGIGMPPFSRALGSGVRFCLGTDNVTVCQPDMFSELGFAWACLRRASPRAGSEEARKLLNAATVEPLSIFNLPWGPIEEGQPATFMLLARGNNLLNLTDVYTGLVSRARADNFKAVYVNGGIMESRK